MANTLVTTTGAKAPSKGTRQMARQYRRKSHPPSPSHNEDPTTEAKVSEVVSGEDAPQDDVAEENERGTQVCDGPTAGYRDGPDGTIVTADFPDGRLPEGWHDYPDRQPWRSVHEPESLSPKVAT